MAKFSPTNSNATATNFKDTAQKIAQEEIVALNSLRGLIEVVQERDFGSMARFFDDLFSVFSSQFSKEIQPESVEASYTGIHLGKVYKEEDFMKMVEEFQSGNKLHAKYALQILKDAIAAYQKYPNICECKDSSIIVVGDIHGSFRDLYYIIEKFGIPGKNNSFVFNGDFVDRGSKQIEVLLTLLYAHLLYPEHVFLNRGNHEDLSINLSNHFQRNFKHDVDKKYGQYSLAVFNKAQSLFRCLPVATIVDNRTGVRAFVVHGGLSNRLSMSFINSSNFNRFQFGSVLVNDTQYDDTKRTAEIFSDLIWSDPSASNGVSKNLRRGMGYFFGPDISAQFCSKHGYTTVIRSHEVRDEGFSQDHKHCVTIFSSSLYCGGSNKAAVIIIKANRPGFDVHKFQTQHSPNGYERHRKHLLTGFKNYLDHEANDLFNFFRADDPSKTGYINVKKMTRILSNYIQNKEGIYIEPNNFYILKDYMCPCNQDNDLAQYTALFTRLYKEKANSNLFEFLRFVFNLINLDRTGTISISEARRAIQLMNSKLNTNYNEDFITKMDTNRDGIITINDFQASFAKAYKL